MTEVRPSVGVLPTDESQYPSSDIVCRVIVLVSSCGEYVLEGLLAALRFEFGIAVGLDQLVCRGRIVVRVEGTIQFTELPVWVIAPRFLLIAAGPGLLYLSLALAVLVTVHLLIAAACIIYHVTP